ncbi:hypothetical protein UlMin_024902 [Ulmus minor]
MKKQKRCLPDDVIQIIMSKLPVKTLMRCKCLSKEWNSVINTTDFISSHLLHSSTSKLSIIEGINLISGLPKLLLLRNETTVQDLELPLFARDNIQKIHDLRTRIVVGSCNGLICFNLSDNYTTILLWNPATRESRYLPEPMLMFTKQRFPYQLSFGFDHFNNDYKLVRVTQKSTLELGVQIFKQSTNYWRGVKGISGYRMTRSEPMIVNGVLYLLAGHDKKNEVNLCILRFNLCHEEFQKVLDLPSKTKNIMFTKWKESFAVAEQKDLECNFWIMNDGLLGWTKLFKINGCFACDNKSYFLGTWKDQVLFIKHSKHDRELEAHDRELEYEYDTEELEYERELTILDAIHGDYMNNHRKIKKHGIMNRYFYTFDYMESLVSVNPDS